MLKLLAFGWHIWDTQDAFRHNARPGRKFGALIGLAWSATFFAAHLLEAERG